MRKRYRLPLAKLGEYPHGDLIQVIDNKSLDAIVSNTMAGFGKTGKMVCDYDHYSSLSADVKKALSAIGVQLPTAAAGWISNVYRDGDTVWGDMVATPDGEEAIDSGTYSKTSPTFRLIDCEFLKNRGSKKLVRPLRVKSVALCNRPNMESLGQIMANRQIIENKEDDLQSVFLGSAMDILEKGKANMENNEVIENAMPVEAQAEPVKEDAKPVEAAGGTSVEEAKATVVETVVEAVATEAEAQGATPEVVEAVAQVAEEATVSAVEAVETAVEEAKAEESIEAEDAKPSELEEANAKIAELSAKVAELEAVIEEAGKAREKAELQNRIDAELAKYPTLQNREEASELLKMDWDLGTRFLGSIKFSVPSQTIQNRIPAKTPEVSMAGMSARERIKFKMFGR